MDITAAGKEFFKQLPRAHGLVIVKIHPGYRREKMVDSRLGDLEFLLQQGGEIIAVKCGLQRKLGIVKNDILELDNRLSDLFGPVFFAGLDHAIGKAMQGDIEDMAFALKPSGKASKLVVKLKKQNLVAAIGQPFGRGQATQAGANNNDIVSIGSFI
jgi:hypothetical protein